MKLDADLRREYETLFAHCRVRPERAAEVAWIVRKVQSARQRYDAVAWRIGCPWQVVGALHAMECALDFRTHLHNGDPLSARTVRVPAGRPPTGAPPFRWEDSAVDALRLAEFDRWKDWSVAGTLYMCEAYNGWGYRRWHAEVKSPYLWASTTHYECGKYVADGKWSATAVSSQVGVAALLKASALEEWKLAEGRNEALRAG